MTSTAYLSRLTIQLAAGVSRLPAETRTLHAGYLLRRQNADGGWSGREGESDLYYTGFALRGLAVLDALSVSCMQSAAGFLEASLRGECTVVDFFSLLYACALVQMNGGPDVLRNAPAGWHERVAATLEALRARDGGYGKTIGAASGSTYHSFLVALCYELLNKPLPDPEALARFIHSRQREDGGYVEIAPMRRGGTNPTAAAVGILELTASLTPKIKASVAGFLVEMASFEGGLRANARAPLADLLSTFTAGWTLLQLGELNRLDKEQMRSFVDALEQPDGGFRGGLWDEACDVEYTFYGLGALALFQ